MLTYDAFKENLALLVERPEKSKYLLAVSGGADSCVLAFLFHHFGLDFDVAHCNFHLRGEDSDKDMEFVKQIPYLFDKQIFVKEFDTLKLQKGSGRSIEMVARDLRYEWFRELASGYDYVVTAHNADDNAETLLLNLVRGTGLKGLSGIPTLNPPFMRPLLPFSSAEIREFAAANNIAYRTDKSNFSDVYNRNRIRLNVLPELSKINPKIIDVFSRNIDVFSRQNRIYEQEIERLKSKVLTFCDKKNIISIEELKKTPDIGLLLYEILSKFNFNKSVLKEIEENLEGNSGKIFYSPTHKLLKDREKLIIIEKDKADENEIGIEIKNDAELEKNGFKITKIDTFDEILKEKMNKNVIFVSKKKFSYPLFLRKWQAGDEFYPFGLKGKKKLSDFFKDLKLNLIEKDEIDILCCNDSIMWVVGIRADDRFKVLPQEDGEFYRIEKTV